MSNQNFTVRDGFSVKTTSASPALANLGDINVNLSSSNLQYYNGSGASDLATASNTLTFSGKSLDAASNTFTNIANSAISASANIAYSKLNLAASVKNSDLTTMAANTIKGNNTGSTGAPLDLTVAQVNAILPTFTSTLNGLAPLSGGGTTNYLRADGTWSQAATSVSVVSANGLAGTVANATTTPAITLSTTVTGVLQGNGTAISAASTTGTGSVVLAGTPTITNLNAGSTQITNIADPTSAQQAATKNYVDTVASGLEPIQSVYAATIGSNITGTYLNGASGIGATFTTTSTTTPFTLDGTTPPLNSRILIKDQTSGFQDGVYNFTTAPVAGVSGAIFTRAFDYDTASDMNAGGIIPIINGTVNAPSGNPTFWIQTATITTVGTDSLTFVKFNSGGSGTVTSVALTAPALFSVAGSPVTTSGTLALTYSGTALPIANGGTNAVTASAAYNNLSPMTTTGDIEIEASAGVAARLAAGTQGQVLTMAVTGLPAWQTNPITTFQPVVASYYTSTNSTPGTQNPINFDTKIYDSNNAVTTGSGWKFTAPVAGTYAITSQTISTGSSAWQIGVIKNGTTYTWLGQSTNDGINTTSAYTMSLNAGDFISLCPSGTQVVSGGTLVSTGASLITISQVSGGSATGPISAKAYTSSLGTTSANTPIIFGSVVYDTNSAYNASTGRYTVPVSGIYQMIVNTLGSTSAITINAYQNGTLSPTFDELFVPNTGSFNFTTQLKCNAGDIIDVRPNSSYVGSSGSIYFNLLSGSSTQAPVNARYFSTTSTISSSYSTITYATKDYDSNSAYSGGTYTIPVAGKYQVCASVEVTGNGNAEIHSMGIFQNGTQKNICQYQGGGAVTDLPQSVSDILNCSVGDTITVQVKSPTATALTVSNFANFFSISRISG